MKSFGFCVFLLLGCGLWAQAGLISGRTGEPQSLDQGLSEVQAGDLVVIGEVHGNAACQSQQLQILRALREQGFRVQVGMEFLEFPFQGLVDAYRSGVLGENEFLKQVGWGGFPFELYRDQILFPEANRGETTRALNAPKSVTRRVSQEGLEALTPEERAFLPPGLTRGNALYFERFRRVMQEHVPDAAKLERYFWAQSIWDDTMAWQAQSFLRDSRESVFVIVVGEFHVQYGGGLPERLVARTGRRVHTVSQVDLSGLDENARAKELRPDPVFGARADLIWSFEQDQDRSRVEIVDRKSYDLVWRP